MSASVLQESTAIEASADRPEVPAQAVAWTHEIVAAGIAISSALLITLLPHMTSWLHRGTPVWFADHDDVDIYLVVASHAYRYHPFYLSDPIHPSGAVYLPWLIMVPGIVTAKVLRLGPELINLVYRAEGGLGLGIGFYLLFRFYVASPWVASGLAILSVFDSGTLSGRPLERHVYTFARLVSGRGGELLQANPQIYALLRIVDPTVPLPLLLFYWCALARCLHEGTRPRIVCCGIALGLLFSYFYFWTAALAGLALAFAIDPRGRMTYLQAGAIGLLIGLPAVVSGYLFKHSTNSDWLPRADRFFALPRMSEILVPKVALILLMIAGLIVWHRRRDLLFLWCFAAAAMALVNEQIVTGIWFENAHYMMAWGPALWILIVLIVWAELQERPALRPWAPRALAAAVTFAVGTGIWMRTVEATRTWESVDLTSNYLKFRSQEKAAQDHSLQAGTVIGGDSEYVNLSAIEEGLIPLSGYWVEDSAYVDNSDWDRRVAIDGYLRGLARDAFIEEQSRILEKTRRGWASSQAEKQRRLLNREAFFDQAVADPQTAIDYYHVNYVALRPGESPPQYIRVKWSILEAGPYWQVWAREISRPTVTN